MENRERDRVSQRTEPTDAGQINRQTSEELGREVNGGTSAEFGQKIGRSEDLREGGEMRNRNEDDKPDRNNALGNESSRRSGSGELGSMSRDESPGRRGSTGNMGNTGTTGGADKIGGSTQGRH